MVKLYFNMMFSPTKGPDVSINKALVNDTDEKALQEFSHEP